MGKLLEKMMFRLCSFFFMFMIQMAKRKLINVLAYQLRLFKCVRLTLGHSWVDGPLSPADCPVKAKPSYQSILGFTSQSCPPSHGGCIQDLLWQEWSSDGPVCWFPGLCKEHWEVPLGTRFILHIASSLLKI